MPGRIPQTSQLDWLISTTAMIVLFWSRATRDLLRSFGWGIAALHRLHAATKLPPPRRPPHRIYRSLSYDQTRMAKKARELVRKISRDACAPVKCANGAAILTIEWLDRGQCHARTLYRQFLGSARCGACQRRHVRGQAALWSLHRHGVGRRKHLFPSGVRSAWRYRDQARSRSRYAADHRLQGDHARSGGYAHLCGRAFGPRGGRMAVSRLGLPRAAAVAEQLRTRGVDHAARQSEFSWVRRFPAHGVGPCRPGARRSVPRLLFSRCRARTLLFRSRLYDLSFS